MGVRRSAVIAVAVLFAGCAEPQETESGTLQIEEAQPPAATPRIEASPELRILPRCTYTHCVFSGGWVRGGPAPDESLRWDFADGGTAVGSRVEHTFERAGQYFISLRGKSSDGQDVLGERVVAITDAAPTQVTVASTPTPTPAALPAAPQTAITPLANATCNGLQCTFDARGTTSNVGGLSFLWSFGDGTAYSSNFTQHTYGKLGRYDVVLRVSAPDGTAATTTVIADVTDLTARARAPPIPPGAPAATKSATIEVRHEWTFDGKPWTWNYTITRGGYQSYKDRDRTSYANEYASFVLDPSDDQWIDALAVALQNAADKERWTRPETADFVLTFVQSLPYSVDNETTPFDEYPRFPIETLAEFTGDCEDTSILYASLLVEMGYKTVLLSMPGHMAVGVAGSFSGSYYELDLTKYYFAETTGEGYRVGDLPPAYKGVGATLLSLKSRAILTDVDWKIDPAGSYYSVRLNVTNVGNLVADDVTLGAAYDAGNDLVWHDTKCDAIDIDPFGYAWCQLSLPAMTRGTRTRVILYAIADNAPSSVDHTEWFSF